MIEAVIFDFDGLIVDTEIADYLSWKEMYESFGCELPLDVWQENIGSINIFNPYTYLEKLVQRPLDYEAIKRQRRQRDDELMAQQGVLPGVTDYLAEARQLGLAVGIASSSRREWVNTHLARLGLVGQFDAIRCRDDVNGVPKPEPDVYLAALDALETTVVASIAFEDSANGLLAAKRAGLHCVVVPNQMTKMMDFSLADRRLNALTDLSLTQLLEEMNHNGQS